MDRAPPAPVHLVPPLPQRRSSRSHSVTRAVVSSTSSPPLTLTRNEYRQQSESTSGRHPARQSSSPQRLPNLSRVASTNLRAVNNDYGDVPPPTPKLLSQLHQQQQQLGGGSNQFGSSRDVIVEISSRGEPMSRTTSNTPFIDVDGNIDGRSKSDKAAVERLSKPADGGVETELSQQPCRESIICADCGKCRCAECARPSTPALCCIDTGPSSSSGTGCQRAFDSVTCMTCVRAVFRRNGQSTGVFESSDDGNDEVGGPPYGYDDDPCSCQPTSARCCRRWTFLVMLSACLPCLCLYLPLRCLCRACANLHSSCAAASHRGCRCRPPMTPPLVTDSWQNSSSKPLQLPQPSKEAKYMSVETMSSGGVRV